jgi:transcriptional regulator with XRE-family HTH domain
MNDKIREATQQAMKRQDISQADLARKVGTTRQAVNRALSGGSGEAPPLWQAMLEALHLELTVQPSSGEPAPSNKEMNSR